MLQSKLGDRVVLLMLCYFFFVDRVVSNVCSPVTWTNEEDIATGDTAGPSGMPVLPWDTNFSVTTNETVQAGEVVCRYYGHTENTVNCCTCSEVSTFYQISLEDFFKLNPHVRRDCSNIKPRTQYCVRGYIQPVVSTDGFCGPHHNNATCKFTDMPCCNSQTWKCGDSIEDCAPGTCWEGLCDGHEIYSTDGKCGIWHNHVLCAGRWGNCCSLDGVCGNGTDFCSYGKCHSGDCDPPARPPFPPPPPQPSNLTPDGTCGPATGYRCSVVYGYCCSKHNVCGALPEDCLLSQGCQPEYGSCD